MRPEDSPIFLQVVLLQSTNVALLLGSAVVTFSYLRRTGSRTLALLGGGLLLLALPLTIGLLDSLFFWSLFGPMTEESIQRSIPIKNAEVLVGQLLTLLGLGLLCLALLRLREEATAAAGRSTPRGTAMRR